MLQIFSISSCYPEMEASNTKPGKCRVNNRNGVWSLYFYSIAAIDNVFLEMSHLDNFRSLAYGSPHFYST